MPHSQSQAAAAKLHNAHHYNEYRDLLHFWSNRLHRVIRCDKHNYNYTTKQPTQKKRHTAEHKPAFHCIANKFHKLHHSFATRPLINRHRIRTSLASAPIPTTLLIANSHAVSHFHIQFQRTLQDNKKFTCVIYRVSLVFFSVCLMFNLGDIVANPRFVKSLEKLQRIL